MKYLLVVALLVLARGSQQDLTTFDGCGPLGSARPGTVEASENPLKNRWHAPTVIDPAITLQTLATATVSSLLDQSKAATVEGYVIGAKPGGVESCNCGSKVDLDTHILVASDPKADRHHVVIVEVTPRLRSLNPAWTQGYLASLKGHLVKFTGFLLMDVEHKVSSFVDNPQGRHNWRSSCWEIHPVTGIEVVK